MLLFSLFINCFVFYTLAILSFQKVNLSLSMSDINKLMHWKPVISSHRFDSQANATAVLYSFLISVMIQFSFVSC